MSQTKTKETDGPTCPQCGGDDVEFYEDLDGVDMKCHDCDEIVEQWARDWGGPINGPGTYQWKASRRGL